MVNQSGDTARTLILSGLVLQVAQVLVFFYLGSRYVADPVIGPALLTLGILGLGWVICVFLFSFLRVRAGEYQSARRPTMIFALLSILTIGLIAGVLYLVAWGKLGDAPESERFGLGF